MTSNPDKYMGRDVYTYTQEKERFQKELFQFHADRHTQFLSLPTVSGKTIDLYRLYLMITKHGGFHKVCDRNLWWMIPLEMFHFPPACANAELALKQIYMRYLYLYERVFVHGDDPDHPDDDDSGPRGSKTTRILVHQVPMSYNYKLHRIRGSDRVHYGLSTDTAKQNEYERLEKSLLSGLPNEVDFAINVCCILSVDSPNSIKLLTHRCLIDLLMAHIGLFSEVSTLKPLYLKEWFPKTKRNFTQFWYDSLESEDIDFMSSLLDMASCTEHRVQDEVHYLGKRRCLAGYDVLHLGRDDDGKDSLYRRVQQVSNIIRNLSFDSANAQALSESVLIFKFAMLCCHNSLPELKRNGMDIFANISKKYIMSAIHESSTQVIVRSIHKWILSKDKQELVGALLTLAALSQVEQNEEILVESLPQEIYAQIVSLARIYDLQLIVSALDALYYLSEIGEATCECISLVKHCIDFLANLVTVETQSFGESALGGIIVRDHGIPSQQQPHQPSPHSRPVGTMMGPPATPSNSRPMPRQPQMMQGHHQMHTMPPKPCTPPLATAGTQMTPLQRTPTPPYRPGSPRAGLAPAHKHILPATPQNLATMSPEQVACNWLRANYEPYPGSLELTAKAHHLYVAWLQKRGGFAAYPVPPTIFVNCVKKVFPYSELVPNGAESQLSGIRWKPSQQSAHNQPNPQMRPLSTLPPAYNSHHILSPGSPAPGMPPRISSPSSHTAANEMLRSMLVGEPQHRPRSNSGTSGTSSTVSSGKSSRSPRTGRRGGRGSRSASPRSRSIGDSPLPPISPASSMELQICGSAEKVESFVNGASLAKIERVENPQSPASLSSQTNQKFDKDKSSNNIISTPTDLSDNPSAKHNGVIPSSVDLKNTDSVTDPSDSRKKVEEDNDSAMDNTEHTTLSLDSTKSNGTKDALRSPPLCNGNTSDSDSLLTAPNKAIEKLLNGESGHTDVKHDSMNGSGDGSGDSSAQKTFPPTKNGFINGLEKMIASISEERLKSNPHKLLPDHRRHHSGDSLASQSSTSTQLSVSQTSQSSDHKHELPDLAPNQLLAHTPPPNQQSAQPVSTNQQSGKSASSNQQPAQQPSANHIPTVVDAMSRSNSITPPMKPGIIVPTHPLNTISVNTSDSSSTTSKSPLGSPAASSAKKTPGRKRRRSTASTDSNKPSLPDATGQYKCLWECCGYGFTSCSLLRKHVGVSHTNQAGSCLWAGCDRVDRRRWALVSHVNERHTSDSALAKALADREKGIIPSQSSQQPPSIYTPQASRIAILRNFPKPPFTEFLDSREGPVTKHIRFTAALILRNICRYSPTGRTLMKKHESSFALIAGSTMEASSAIVNCLWEMQQSR